MAKGQKTQLVTKKHLARQERERRQNRIILITSLAVIIVVVGLIGYGLINKYIIEPAQPVAKVGNQKITTRQFQTYALYLRLQYIQQYQQYQQLAQMFGSDQSGSSYFQQYLSQISYSLEPSIVGQNALDYLIENRLVQMEADKRGITVSDEEINQTLRDGFGYYPNGTPTSKPTSIIVPTSTLNPTQLALVTATSTATATATITPTPVITGTQQASSPTPTTVITPTATTTPSITSTPLPTATPYTLSEYEKNLKTYMTDVHSFAGLSEADFRWAIGMQLLQKKVLDAITADISRQQDQVWVRHIVVTDQAQAQTIYQRLIGGENFEKVATEVYSGTQSAQSIDLGWLGTGTLDANAERVVYALQIGQISVPVQTATGWEVYQLLGHEVRTLNDSDFEQLKQKDFQNWVTEQKAAVKVQEFDIWKDRVPTSPTIPPTQASQQ